MININHTNMKYSSGFEGAFVGNHGSECSDIPSTARIYSLNIKISICWKMMSLVLRGNFITNLFGRIGLQTLILSRVISGS